MTQSEITIVQNYLDKHYKLLLKSETYCKDQKVNYIKWLYDQATHELDIQAIKF